MARLWPLFLLRWLAAGQECDAGACPRKGGTALLQVRGKRKQIHFGTQRLPLLPYPANLEMGDGYFMLGKTTRLDFGPGVLQSDLSVEILRRMIDESAAEGLGRIKLELSESVGHPEGYSLLVQDNEVLITAKGAAGLFYAVQTLRQLRSENSIPAVNISDEPRFQWRGLHLDVSRHFFNASAIKSLLETMSLYKLNKFHWHLTDDQGWRLPVPLLPELTRKGAEERNGAQEAYTEEEIFEIVTFARDRFIEILPEVDVPGHAAAAIAAYPELGNKDSPEFKPLNHPYWDYGVKQYTLAPSQRVVEFLRKVFKQLSELFPGSFVHVGGDEAPTHQWASSRGARLASLKHYHVQTWFTEELTKLTQELNKTLVGWDEIQHLGGLKRSAVVMAWRSRLEVQNAVKMGRRVVNADMESLYFDHYQGAKELEPKAICCLTKLKEVYDYDPMPSGLRPNERKLVLGPQAQLWTEYMKSWEHVEYMAFPRALAMAERAWTPLREVFGYGDFVSRLPARLAELKERGVHFRELDFDDML